MAKRANARLDADLLIVGGGLIGLSLALAAARAGLETVLVERTPPQDSAAAGFDGRVSSLAWGSHAMYRTLGLWPALAGEAEPILEIRVADGASPAILHFDHREVGERPFGFMIENRHLRRALQAAVAAAEGVRYLAPARTVEVRRQASGVIAELEDGRSVRAALVAAADGRASPLREAAGIRCLSWRYPQTAIVGTLAHALPHFGVAKEHFQGAGPFALLPMTGNRSSMVWTERAGRAPAYLRLDDAGFAREVALRAGEHLGRIEPVGPRWSHPLGLLNAERYIDRRLALVGDAAHAMHPLAGQGLNLGLRDVAWLVEVLAERARLGLDIGDEAPLRRYQRRRRPDALAMLLMTDGLNRLFSNEARPLRALRGLGLAAVQRTGPAKRFFERRAAALAGDLPRLIRGQAV